MQGKELNKDSFRRRMLGSGLLAATAACTQTGYDNSYAYNSGYNTRPAYNNGYYNNGYGSGSYYTRRSHYDSGSFGNRLHHAFGGH